MSLGASYFGDGRTAFEVWAPLADEVTLKLIGPADQTVPMHKERNGYFRCVVPDVEPGARYVYVLNGETLRADPASKSQPEGVHGPSEVVDVAFAWTDGSWRNLPLARYVIYELHVGTFSEDGTFEGVIPHLASLKELGITAIELMPIAQFPGDRNWGYDGVFPFAAQNSYGGPRGLQRFVDACHGHGLAVVLDVVYNHLGPEGNYLRDFGPYFTGRYQTPWGEPLNFDGPESDEVRRYFIENALYWIRDCHVDALRLDAVHAIFDFSAHPFLQELSEAVNAWEDETGSRAYLIAESGLNDPHLVRTRDAGGLGLDGQWSDDFHHTLHVALTGEQDGYYVDFAGVSDLAKAFRHGYVYTGERSEFRARRFGELPSGVERSRFVVFAQNHDQVGNRMLGERLSQLVSFEQLKLAAAVTLLSPYVPLLFMGEEHGEKAPFLYFTSHSDPDLVEAVREGRKQEFEAFAWQGEPPDPQTLATFEKSRIASIKELTDDQHTLRKFYQKLLQLRAAYLTKAGGSIIGPLSWCVDRTLVAAYGEDGGQVMLLANFASRQSTLPVALAGRDWHRALDSSDEEWRGPGGLVAERITGNDRVELSLRPFSVVVLAPVRDE